MSPVGNKGMCIAVLSLFKILPSSDGGFEHGHCSLGAYRIRTPSSAASQYITVPLQFDCYEEVFGSLISFGCNLLTFDVVCTGPMENHFAIASKEYFEE